MILLFNLDCEVFIASKTTFSASACNLESRVVYIFNPSRYILISSASSSFSKSLLTYSVKYGANPLIGNSLTDSNVIALY